jgi:hypothetical protein
MRAAAVRCAKDLGVRGDQVVIEVGEHLIRVISPDGGQYDCDRVVGEGGVEVVGPRLGWSRDP